MIKLASAKFDPTAADVVLLVPSMSGGGAERAALNLVPAMSRYRASVLAEWRGGELQAEAGVQHIFQGSTHRGRPPRPVRILRLARELRRSRPRAVISFLSPLVATEAARLAGVPVIHWLQSPMSTVKPFATSGLSARVNRAVLAHVGRRSTAVIGASPGSLEELSGILPTQTATAVIPNPVRLPHIASADHPGPGRIVSIGRLAPEKRHDVLVQAFAEIADGRGTRLVLFGNGPLENVLESQARTLGIGHLVDFEGFVDSPAERLLAQDVFALCSDFEGFGNAFAEALARGVRVVATDAPYGARYVLGGLQIAQLVPPGDPAAVAQALRTALDAGQPGETERRAARARAERFGPDRVAADVEDLLDQLLPPI